MLFCLKFLICCNMGLGSCDMNMLLGSSSSGRWLMCVSVVEVSMLVVLGLMFDVVVIICWWKFVFVNVMVVLVIFCLLCV